VADGGSSSAIGAATNNASNLVLSNATLRYTGTTASTNHGFTIGAGTTATIDVSTSTENLTISGSAAATSGALVKAGTGTLTLSGQNLHTGGTTVNSGTLNLSGTDSGTGILRNAVTVNNGATLLLSSRNALGYTVGAEVSSVTVNAGGTVTNAQASDQGFRTQFIMNGGSVGVTGSGAAIHFTSISDSFPGSHQIETVASSGTSNWSAPINIRGTSLDVDTATGTTLNISGVMGGGAKILNKSGVGTLALSGVNTYSGATNVSGGMLKTVSPILNGAAISATNNGVIDVPANGTSTGVSNVGAVTINTGGKIDLHDNDMVINYTAGNGAATYASTVTLIKAGLVSLGGTGSGIASTEVDNATLPGTTLGVADNANVGLATLSGYTIPNASSVVVVKYTWAGDANLDGKVDGSDYALVDTGFAGGGTTWDQGDVDLSGNVNGSDYSQVDTGFASQNGTLPEPTTLGLLGLGAMGMLRRRRRTQVA